MSWAAIRSVITLTRLRHLAQQRAGYRCVVSGLGGFPWIEGIDNWRRSVTAELEALPETLRLFREGVSNFQRITARLLDATDAMEQFTRKYTSGVADARRRLDAAGESLREQVTSATDDPVRGAVEEFTKALSAMAELNPLMRRGSAAPKKKK